MAVGEGVAVGMGLGMAVGIGEGVTAREDAKGPCESRNHPSAPPPITTRPPKPPKSLRRLKLRDAFCAEGGISGVGEGT